MSAVLIVDDNAAICRTLRRLFAACGHEADCCCGGREAIDYLAGHRPDLVVLDWMMPEVPGDEVLRSAAADPRLAGVPIVVYTASGDPSIGERAQGLGAAAVILKAGGWDALYSGVCPLLGEEHA